MGTNFLGIAQFGQSIRFGSVESQVQILLPRPSLFPSSNGRTSSFLLEYIGSIPVGNTTRLWCKGSTPEFESGNPRSIRGRRS